MVHVKAKRTNVLRSIFKLLTVIKKISVLAEARRLEIIPQR